MAAPTNPANVKKVLGNLEPSTHGGQEFESLFGRAIFLVFPCVSHGNHTARCAGGALYENYAPVTRVA